MKLRLFLCSWSFVSVCVCLCAPVCLLSLFTIYFGRAWFCCCCLSYISYIALFMRSTLLAILFSFRECVCAMSLNKYTSFRVWNTFRFIETNKVDNKKQKKNRKQQQRNVAKEAKKKVRIDARERVNHYIPIHVVHQHGC